jgi:flavin reductase (DIM6/NTAB) family NADH-FMN oxidoreductase RutF
MRAPAHRGIDPESFRQACAYFGTGIAVATVRGQDGTPHGLTISSFTSVSIVPPLILICIDFTCPFLSHCRLSTHFGVNVLCESQRDISVTFAEKPEGRFDGVEWFAGRCGAPLLPDCLATIECRAASIIEAGDHAIFVGEVEHAESREGRPLLYFNRDYRYLS